MRVKYLRNQYTDQQWFNELKKFEKKETKTKFAYKSGGLMKNPKVAKELA